MSTGSSAKLIGSLLFCPVCSTLLDLPGDKDIIVCEQCNHEEPAQCTNFHTKRTTKRVIMGWTDS